MRNFIRVWEEVNIQEIEKTLIVIGELSAECFSCHKIGIDSKAHVCPACGTNFKYVGFRRRVEGSYLHRIKEEMPYAVFIDFDDFKKAVGKKEARKLLDI